VGRDLTITIKIGGESSMKGVAVAALVAAALLACMGVALATPPLTVPMQYEQFCENQKVSGTGVIDVSTSIVDKKIALEYYNVMAGDGDLELDQTHAYSQKSDKLQRNISAVNDSNASKLNLFENTKLTYSAVNAPLTGGKYINSKAFYGGIGADVQEMFSVNQMEKDQTTFFVSTANISPDFQKQANILKKAGEADVAAGNEDQVSQLMGNDPAHLIGMDTKNSFNGTWGVDAKWHKIFYKDIKLHEMFTGTFEAEKMIKFHEYPVPENVEKPCAGIDC
jgi:hypothetical protein